MHNELLKFSHKSAKEGQWLLSEGNFYRVIATGAETNSHYSLVEIIVEPGKGAPFHFHKLEEEAFFILEGEMVFYTQTETMYGKQGAFLNFSVGQIRGFRNETDENTRMLIILSPPGMEQMFFEDGKAIDAPIDLNTTFVENIGQPVTCPEIAGRYSIENVPLPLPEKKDNRLKLRKRSGSVA
ncbi:cupin domain-containing protein [Xenorhabdus bovienii]|uniref:cupin domain-containing protein n=1 Tax=Xenorhabdus bovienii TaxID=40576 RepID=UPI0023B23EE8|nr:cupin domain-containing protein [Xenorhabdus bovienii]MDE9431959.1 cupin domain-containing protein [Xenorhabdus bovienii]MDE9489685.1 cupin domain-containing protein [Xenorhabdus bovienii]MDE9505959.1 cupin domain-containing protein [Xenorhabdus bovienii]MDE9547687.1 cupin domain-containing protein [Xenorhabdus bovienii]